MGENPKEHYSWDALNKEREKKERLAFEQERRERERRISELATKEAAERAAREEEGRQHALAKEIFGPEERDQPGAWQREKQYALTTIRLAVEPGNPRFSLILLGLFLIISGIVVFFWGGSDIRWFALGMIILGGILFAVPLASFLIRKSRSWQSK